MRGEHTCDHGTVRLVLDIDDRDRPSPSALMACPEHGDGGSDLENLIGFLELCRGTGSTTAAIRGLACCTNRDGEIAPGTLVIATRDQERNLPSGHCRPVTLAGLLHEAGRRAPVIVDNHAIVVAASGALSTLRALRREVVRLMESLGRARSERVRVERALAREVARSYEDALGRCDGDEPDGEAT